MQGFKGLLPRQAIASQSLQCLVKKTEQHRLYAYMLVDFFKSILKLEQMRVNTNDKVIKQCIINQFQNTYNKNISVTIVRIANEWRAMVQNIKTSVEETVSLSNNVFSGISMQVTRLQQALESYCELQQQISQLSRKYFKTHKQMLLAIQSYKASFSDVNLIYNMDQKTKRYQNCQILYRSIKEEHKIINQQCEALLEKKINLGVVYTHLIDEFGQGIKKVGDYSVEKLKEFLFYLCFTVNNIVEIFKKLKFSTQKIVLQQIFKEQFVQQKLQIFMNPQLINKQTTIPLLLQYSNLLKQQNLRIFNQQIPQYLKLIQQRLKLKKSQSKRIFDFVNNYFKNLQKVLGPGVKDLLIQFEKNRKKISECFGNRLITFMKAASSVYQIFAGISQKTDQQINSLLKVIESIVSQQSRLVKSFTEQINTNQQRFIIKKLQQPNLQLSEPIVKQIRKQMLQKTEYIKHLITGFQQKIDKISMKLVNSYNQLMFLFSKAVTEYYSFCNEYYQVYFGDVEFVNNMQKYNEDFDKVRAKNRQKFLQLQINSVSNDNSKILFEGDIGKIEDFKKLKKPLPTSLNTPDSKSELSSMRDVNQQEKSVSGTQLVKNQSSKSNTNINEEIKDNNKKIQFLKTKFNFKQNEKYVKSFNCALAQKIILHGKIFITTQRVAFYSKFNSNNIFFGKTFIQFPKLDIKKIQKRQNSLLLDNSISFTTVNGQVFFTYFFSRDQAYDIICKTFNFSLDDNVYEYEENQVNQIPQFLIENQQKDDIKLDQLEQRKTQIQAIMPNFPYVQVSKVQINQEGLNAIKIFKIFFHQNEINYNNKKYPNFLLYFKQLISHKDIQVAEWTPPLNQILNQSNIKQTAHKCSKRLIKATIPVSSSGVPFMPKTAQTEESQTLFFFSKHKFIIQSTIQTKGAPYTDTFRVELRTIVESNQDGKCKLSVEYFLNFVKSTMMKSVIQSKSKQQTISGTSYQLNQIKRYFDILKSKPKKGENKSVDQLKFDLQVANRQVAICKEQNANLITKLSLVQNSQKKFKYILIASLILNIMLILMIIL